MSFLAGRLAGKEGAYFFQESKHAITRLAQKTPPPTQLTPNQQIINPQQESTADVLPEVLRHSLPAKVYSQPSDGSSLSTLSKWALPSRSNTNDGSVSSVSPDALNPLRAYVALPRVTFGPKRWELPHADNSVLASTANESRQDRHQIPVNPEKLKAAAEGLANIGKAFAVATALVFGGASLLFGLAASKLELHNTDDIRVKGKDLVQPRFEGFKEQIVPLKTWAENVSKKWHLEQQDDIKQKPVIKELSKILGARTSS